MSKVGTKSTKLGTNSATPLTELYGFTNMMAENLCFYIMFDHLFNFTVQSAAVCQDLWHSPWYWLMNQPLVSI